MELPELAAAYPAGRHVFLAGAGVSYSGPSYLPLSLPLPDIALQRCCNDAVRQRLRRVWDETNKIVARAGNQGSLGLASRLESIRGDINDVGRRGLRRLPREGEKAEDFLHNSFVAGLRPPRATARPI